MQVNITDLNGKLVDQAAIDDTMRLLVTANRGTFGFDKWGTGYWCKYNEFWDAKATWDIKVDQNTMQVPFKIGSDIVTVYDVSASPVVSTVYYLSNTDTFSVVAHRGKKVVVVCSFIANVRN